MTQLVLKDQTTYDCVNVTVREEDGVNKSVSAMIVIKTTDKTTKAKIVKAIESKGLDKVIYDNGETKELTEGFSLVDANVVENASEDGFYLGTDENDNPIYAKSTVLVNVLSDAEAVGYVDNYRSEVIANMSQICHDTIAAGLDVTLTDKSVEHFSYDDDDRSNIKEMFDAVVIGATDYPYHKDGGDCRTYSKADIIAIYVAMVSNKTHHTTYFNQLKQYIKSLNNVSSLASIEYGQELTGKYLDTYNANIAEAQNQLEIIISKISK